MSNIKLYHIHGLNEVETIRFANITDQTNYFDRFVVATPDDGFYVPHFKDKIILTSDDVTFNTLFNYLSLDFNNRKYYYFVKSFKYIDELSVEIEIEIDTIQTYLFDINITSGVVERKLINRFVDNKINRNYIRENVSKSDMALSFYKNYARRYSFSSEDFSRDYGLLVIKSGKKLDHMPFDSDYGVATPIWASDPDIFTSDNEVTCSSPYYLYLLPMIKYGEVPEVDIKKRTGPSTYVNDGTVSYSKVFELIARDPNIVEMKYIPYGTVANLYMSNGDIIYDPDYFDRVSYRTGDTPVPADPPISLFVCNRTSGIHSLFVYDDYNVGFVKETGFIANFNANYCPVLMDNNYMRISYGEGGFMTTMPLEKSLTSSVRLCLLSDINTGDRIYQIKFDGEIKQDTAKPWERLISDPYTTIITANKPLISDLIYDQSNQWESRNKFTVLASIAQVSLRAFGITDESPASHKAHAVGVGLSALTEAANAQYAPDGARVTGEISIDYFSKALYPRLEIYKVQDFDACARYFESNGYLVKEYHSYNYYSQPLKTMHTRYFFDVLKMSDINFEVNNSIDSKHIIDNIRERLTNGIRLWHTYTYNNQVVTNIENQGLHLGDTCILNNGEIA